MEAEKQARMLEMEAEKQAKMLEIEAANAKTNAKEVTLTSMMTGVEIMKVDLNTVSSRKRSSFEKMQANMLKFDNEIRGMMGLRLGLFGCLDYGCVRVSGMGITCVYVHHVDKDAFLKGNIDPDPDELDMVFDCCPSYAELLEQVRKDLNWMDPSDVVEFDGGHNVGLGMHIRWKTMRVNSEQRWLAYKDMVDESLDKALELFAIKINDPNLHLDLNWVASPIVEASPPCINEEANIKPLLTQQSRTQNSKIQHEPLLEENDEHDDDENDDTVLHDNNLDDLDKYNLQETMDHSIPYSRGYASESNHDGPDEEVDEERFTTKEAEAFTKVLGVGSPDTIVRGS
ncbi:hypothetical protein D1007_00556 [Hordeum vulgare]|nr:hypothetical protein D1007_00556 [Hordeum vulgare]